MIRRCTLLLLLGALALQCAADGLLLVGNKSADTLWALDLLSGERRGEARTGIGPHEIAVSPDRGHAVVSNYGRKRDGHTLSVFALPGLALERVIELGEGARPHGIAFLPNGHLAVTAEGHGELLLVDTGKGQVLRRIAVGSGTAHMVAVSGDGRFAFVTNISTGVLVKLDLATGELLQSAFSGAGAEGLALAANDSEVWVTNRNADTLSVFDSATLGRRATLGAPGFPIRVTITPDGKEALVTLARAAKLAVYDVERRELSGHVELARDGVAYRETLLGKAALPVGVRVAPDGRRVFVALSGGDCIAVVDRASWQHLDCWPTGREPDAMGIVESPLR